MNLRGRKGGIIHPPETGGALQMRLSTRRPGPYRVHTRRSGWQIAMWSPSRQWWSGAGIDLPGDCAFLEIDEGPIDPIPPRPCDKLVATLDMGIAGFILGLVVAVALMRCGFIGIVG